MKEVGDKFGAGELILPFVLQSAEVMKRAVAQLERYLDKLEGYTKGTVVIATVFGDVHDIGKSLVNTILTNNGYTVVDLGKQVPISTILDAAVEHDATAIGLSALLVSTSKQMPACVQELHERQLAFPVLIGGAAINRNFGLRILYPHGTESDETYEPGVFYCKDAFEGLAKMDQLIDPEAREGLVAKTRAAAQAPARAARRRARPRAPDVPTPRCAAAPAPTTRSPSRRSGARASSRSRSDEVYRHLDTHVLFKLHWGGRGVKGEEWARLLRDDFQPRLERMWREQDYLHPRALLGYFPCNSDGNELIVWDPSAARRARELERLVFPASPATTASAWPTSTARSARELDVVALQAVTAGDEVTELMASLEAEGEFRRAAVRPRPRRPDRRGDGRVAARARALRLGIAPDAGSPLLVGLPVLPRAVRARQGLPAARRALDRPAAVGRLRRRARAVDAGDRRPPSPGGLLRDEIGTLPRNAKQAADELIAGTDKDPTRLATLSEDEPAMAGAVA